MCHDWESELKQGVRAEISEPLIAAIKQLLIEDRYLLDHDANERSLSHRLAGHLTPRFRDWQVDCEYNLMGHDPKRVRLDGSELVRADDTNGSLVYPDIIIHHRGVPEAAGNLLAVEIKKTTTAKSSKDADKLRAYRRHLGYEYTLLLIFGVEGKGPEVQAVWIRD